MKMLPLHRQCPSSYLLQPSLVFPHSSGMLTTHVLAFDSSAIQLLYQQSTFGFQHCPAAMLFPSIRDVLFPHVNPNHLECTHRSTWTVIIHLPARISLKGVRHPELLGSEAATVRPSFPLSLGKMPVIALRPQERATTGLPSSLEGLSRP